MKSSTARWTTALAATACLATPSFAWSQTPPTSQSPTEQQQPSTPRKPTTQQQPPASAGQSGEAQEHLRQAQSALNDIPATVPAPAKSRIAELKRRVSNLEKLPASAHAEHGATPQGAKTTAPAKSNWSTEVAAIDKTLTELLGPASTTGATEPTGTTGAAGSKSRPATAINLDETTKSKLMEVRTHITAYAAAMSGTSGGAAPTPSSEPSQPPATEPAAAAAAQPTSPNPQQNPTTAEQPAQAAAPAGQPSEPAASKQHLTAARESLSQLTQLPAAAQLSGEARTQVSQLITNFNELITTKENWKASYDKVEANVNALLGPEAAEQPQAQTAPTPGAVGTSGTVAASLDPAIRAKLVEFRTHLKQFEQAAGAGSQSEASTASTATPSMASQSPASQSTAGATGTTGTMPPSAEPQSASAMGQDSAVRHIEAIEAILSGGSSSSSSTPGNAPAATTGATTTGNITLNQSQVEEIRMHLTELRKAVKK